MKPYARNPGDDFRVGDCVLVINASYEAELVGRVGTVARAAEPVSGIDRFGRVIAGMYVVVDLPEDVNRHGTTLWYLKREHLLKLGPPPEVIPGERVARDPESSGFPNPASHWIPDIRFADSGMTA